MKRMIAINCSPRTVWNTAALVREAAKLHAACSSLHFEAVEDVEWRAVFSEKLMEDVEVCLM